MKFWGTMFAALGLAVAAQAADKTLADVPFWRANAGWWRVDNTYFDRNLDYNIRSYNSVIHIEIDGRTYRETEIKSYAPSRLAHYYGRGLTTEAEGVETVTVTTGEMIDDAGTVRIASAASGPGGEGTTEIRVLSADTAVRVTHNAATGFDSYRMFITLPAPNKRHVANYGLVSDTKGPGAANAAPDARMGDLRGFSLFRGDRIAADEAESWRATFRARNLVKAVIEPGPDGKPAGRRID
ncbi:MAG: hypothetical protein SFV21_20005 [Rhodospirillaceae bacterium]|nr:hypothetical protein [Rhodospirillaceae bacterium]